MRAETKKGGRAGKRGKRTASARSAHIVPSLAAVMDEVYAFWHGAPVADAALREYRALIAVAKAANRAEILHALPRVHSAGSSPKTCAGCALMAGLRRLTAKGNP